MEVAVRKVWLPVKVIPKKSESFQPAPVIYKPKRVNFTGSHQNVIYKIPGSVGKCYEFAFVRAFTRTEAEKYVCCGCRVLKVQNDTSAKGKKVPYVLVMKGMFQVNPVNPTNADHFCKPKTTVDVLHGGHISTLKHAVLSTPTTRGAPKQTSQEDKPLPVKALRAPSQSTDDWLHYEHSYANPEKKKTVYPRIPKNLQGSTTEPVTRVPSIGPRKIMSRLPHQPDMCYEFVEKKTRSVYFDVYHCTACTRKKDLDGHKVGPIPAVHLRGEFYMTDPHRPKHPHFCTPKNVAEVVVNGEMSKTLHEDPVRPMNTIELFEHLREKCKEHISYIRAYEMDKAKVQALEKRLMNRNIAIKMSEERVERIAKEKAEVAGKYAPTPPPTLELQIKIDRESLSSNLSTELIDDTIIREGLNDFGSKRKISEDEPSKLAMPVLEAVLPKKPKPSPQKTPPIKSSPIVKTPYFIGLAPRLMVSKIPQKDLPPPPMLFPVRVVPREEIRRSASLPIKDTPENQVTRDSSIV